MTDAPFTVTDFDALTLEEIGTQCDLAVVVGGDGTMLGIARQLAPYDVPLIGINQGRLGFMTDIPQERMLPLLAAMSTRKTDRPSVRFLILSSGVVRASRIIRSEC